MEVCPLSPWRLQGSNKKKPGGNPGKNTDDRFVGVDRVIVSSRMLRAAASASHDKCAICGRPHPRPSAKVTAGNVDIWTAFSGAFLPIGGLVCAAHLQCKQGIQLPLTRLKLLPATALSGSYSKVKRPTRLHPADSRAARSLLEFRNSLRPSSNEAASASNEHWKRFSIVRNG